MINYIDDNYIEESQEVSEKWTEDISCLCIYEYFKTTNGKLQDINPYLERLGHSALITGINVPMTEAQIRKALSNLIAENTGKGELSFRIIVAESPEEAGFSIYIRTRELVIPLQEKAATGIQLVTAELQRIYPEAKILRSEDAPLRKIPEGSDEVLFVNPDGRITECSRSNFFCVRQGQLYTPCRDILKGITRAQIISLFFSEYKINEMDIYLDDVLSSDEAFITGSTKGIVPVAVLNTQKIGTKCPGQITRMIKSRYSTLSRHTC